MKSIIETLYGGGLNDYMNTKIFQSVQKYREEESVAYENLCKTLSPKQQEFLNDYEEKSSLQQAMENGKLYARGVKIGALLMLEIFNTDLGE